MIGPWPMDPIRRYTRTIDFTQPRSLATGTVWQMAILVGGAPQPDPYVRSITPGNDDLGAAAGDLDHALGLPAGRGGQSGHRPIADDRRSAILRGVVEDAAEGAVGTAVHRGRLHRRAEDGGAGGDVGGPLPGRRPARGGRVHRLPRLRWRQSADARRTEADGLAGLRGGHHQRHGESCESDRPVPAPSTARSGRVLHRPPNNHARRGRRTRSPRGSIASLAGSAATTSRWPSR